MNNILFLRVVNLLSLIAVLTANFLANALPFNEVTTSDVSASVPTLVTPAGFTFGVWGVIYLALLMFVIYQILPSQADNAHIDGIGWWFVISSVANIIWIILWHYEQFALTVVAMLILLISLTMIYVRLSIGTKSVNRWDYLLVNLPFSIYLAWICVATIANVSIFLTESQWDQFGISDAQWAAAVIGLIVALALIFLVTRRDFFFAAVIVWALVGIWAARDDTSWLSYVVAAAAILVSAAILLQLINRLLWNDSAPPITIAHE